MSIHFEGALPDDPDRPPPRLPKALTRDPRADEIDRIVKWAEVMREREDAAPEDASAEGPEPETETGG